jgi:D-tyrosyl-tRNA(Tyr) deacylase
MFFFVLSVFSLALTDPIRKVFQASMRSTRTSSPMRTFSGRFGAMMEVRLCNDGPVTLVLDSRDLKKPRRQHGKETVR